jgi:hypothetical protein
LGTLDRAVARFLVALLLLASAALGLSATASAQPTQLLPGVSYSSEVQFTPRGPVALHVVRGPRPVGLYRLRPVLSNEFVVQRERLSSIERRLSGQATSVGVNGDYFTLADGRPSGVFLRDGVLAAPPNAQRSSTGITLDGLLDVRRVKFLATWRGTGQRRALTFLNKAPGKNGISLFTRDWGPTTPGIRDASAVVLSPFPEATPNADLTSTVAAAPQSGSVRIEPGTAVLVARGNAAAKLQAEAQPGAAVTVRLILQPDWSTVSDAIGGGPVLVRDGKAVYRSNEAFTTAQLAPPAPRTAVGQRADGSILLVTTDGRQPGYSVGMTNFEFALALARLGAVHAMALDGGGSSTLAFEGAVLNSPSDGKERAISTALLLQYYGVYAPPPVESVVSPNGDGVADAQSLSFKIVRPSDVTVTLIAPDGTVAAEESGQREAGAYDVLFPPAPPPPVVPPEGEPAPEPTEPPPPAEGRWTMTVRSTDDQGLPSVMTRRFDVNSTLGFLRVTPSRLVLRRKGRTAPIRWTQAHAARVKVTVETRESILLRTVLDAPLEPGEQAAAWNGRGDSGKLVGSGAYVVRVTATNELGSVSLTQPIVVRRAT